MADDHCVVGERAEPKFGNRRPEHRNGWRVHRRREVKRRRIIGHEHHRSPNELRGTEQGETPRHVDRVALGRRNDVGRELVVGLGSHDDDARVASQVDLSLARLFATVEGG